MKFWKYSSQALATLLAAVSLVQAGGPADGEAAADPNSAVVKLTSEDFKSFIDSNPLVLAEFFAPWCGYCKVLGPEYSKAADILNTTHPDIKLAQIDCTAEEELCLEHGIKGYPTLKILRGPDSTPEDYDGPREANGIAEYMVKQSLPAVQQPSSVDELNTLIQGQDKAFIIQISPSESSNDIYTQVANENRKDYTFITVEGKDLIKDLDSKFTNVDLSSSETKYLVVHPKTFDDVRELQSELTKDSLTEFIKVEVAPYFGDINRDTYMLYMTSPLPLAYYFYNSQEQRDQVEETFNKLGKEFRGKINFVGLDANMFGRHAEILNMNPEIIPLFAIQNTVENKKYGINQEENPEGPSVEQIEQFVRDYFEDQLTPIIKSEPLPTEEEKASQSVVKLVAHNHNEIVNDSSKDVFVKYYAPWCGHCKKLAPTWEELAEIFESNKPDSKVIVANIDHNANDVDTPINIEGYPTLLLYPANGEIDEKTGLRKPIVFEKSRDLDSLIDFIKDNGYHKLDGRELKQAKGGVVEEDEKETVEKEDEEVAHDEL